MLLVSFFAFYKLGILPGLLIILISILIYRKGVVKMGPFKQKSTFIILSFLFTAFILSGCASTAGSILPVTPVKAGVDLSKYANLDLEVNHSDKLVLRDEDMAALWDQIVASLKRDYPNRFKVIGAENPGPDTLQASVIITRYDKGNAFARSMLAGLGAMHIDADVTLKDLKSGEVLASFAVKKTFAWGGAYGETTSIQDVEVGFAKTVAASILGGGEAKK
jgi:hypothetical protein